MRSAELGAKVLVQSALGFILWLLDGFQRTYED